LTILVGILCDGGVVVGTDSSATFGPAHAPTIEQPIDKLHVLDDNMIVASSGHVGHGQRFVEQVRSLRSANQLKMAPLEIGKKISHVTINDLGETLPNVAQLIQQRQLPFCALMAFVYKKRPYLIEFEPGTFQPEIKDKNLWYVSLGSGAAIADPFLGLLRNSVLADGPPDLATGKFAVYWTLHHTCEVNPGGVKEPINIAVLETSSSTARKLSKDELDSHREMVEETYRRLAKTPQAILGNEDAPKIPV